MGFTVCLHFDIKKAVVEEVAKCETAHNMCIDVHCIVHRYSNESMLFATKLKIYSRLKHQMV